MYRVSIPALVIAFFAEIAVDRLIGVMLLFVIGGDAISTDMAPADLEKAIEVIGNSPAFIIAIVIFGTATTFGGGYLAARIARQYPYYHGLAMGLIGIAYLLYFWQANSLWLSLFGVLSNIPVSIWGAHLAKRHIPAAE